MAHFLFFTGDAITHAIPLAPPSPPPSPHRATVLVDSVPRALSLVRLDGLLGLEQVVDQRVQQDPGDGDGDGRPDLLLVREDLLGDRGHEHHGDQALGRVGHAGRDGPHDLERVRGQLIVQVEAQAGRDQVEPQARVAAEPGRRRPGASRPR